MKLYDTFVVWIGLLLILVVCGHAQITINSSDINYPIGSTVVHYVLSGDIPVTPGNSGGPHTWVFTENEFPGGDRDTINIVDPATTVFADSFPTADFSWQFTEFENGGGDTSTAWIYFNQTSNALEWLGAGSSFDTTDFLTINNPPSVSIPFPATYQTNWINNFTNFFSPGPGIAFFDSTYITQTIDAYGTITVPLGTFDCLRIREDDFSLRRTIVNGQVVATEMSTTINYIWIAKNLGQVAIIDSHDDETDPNFTQAQEVTLLAGSPAVHITDFTENTPNSFQLEQNYPNPFNPSTTITYVLPKAALTELSVFDITGKQITTLVREQQAAGRHQAVFDATNYPSGIYFYRLTSGDKQLTRRMVYIR